MAKNTWTDGETFDASDENAIATELNTTEASVATDESNISSLQSSRTADEANITSLLGSRTTDESNLSTAQTNITSLQSSRTTDEANISTNTSAITSLQTSRTADEANIATLQGKMPTGTVLGTTDTQSESNKTMVNPVITGYQETIQSMGVVGATATIPSPSAGTAITATLTASTLTTFTMPGQVSGKATFFQMALSQAATTGGGTAAFTGVRWVGGLAPTITAAINAVDMLYFWSNGSQWFGTYAQGF